MSRKRPASSKTDRSMIVSPRIVAQRGEALGGEKTPHGRLAREKSESLGISIQDFVMVLILSKNNVRGRASIFTSCSQSNGTGTVRLRIL
jgi:hypothetical protein